MKSHALSWLLSGPMFSVGRIVATPACIDTLDRTGTNAMSLVRRHERGDFGKLCDADIRANLEAIRTGARVLSCYAVGDKAEQIWVLTEGNVTTLLLPSEY
jgi:hypothetical protein